MKTFSIGQVAKVSKLKITTLRYYEDLGILNPKRDTGNRRRYDQNDLNWLAFIQRLKATEMPLKKIQQYSALRAAGNSTIGERLTLLNQQLKLLNKKRAELDQHVDFLKQKIRTYQHMNRM